MDAFPSSARWSLGEATSGEPGTWESSGGGSDEGKMQNEEWERGRELRLKLEFET